MIRKYGLIGNPLSHSFSKGYFNRKFEQQQIEAVYELYPLPEIDALPALIKAEPLLLGLNVTIPYKKKVIGFLDELSPEAKVIGAINTVSIQRTGKTTRIKGWNTDASAFGLELTDFAGVITGNALILGTGGAAAAAAYVLKRRGWKYKMVSRQHNQAGDSKIIAYSDLTRKLIEETSLIVNASPAGMYPDIESVPDLPWEWINKQHLLFDMVYNPTVTRFISLGTENGARTRNGLGMLYKQAELAWKIWQTDNIQEK